jgi:hypothetical protein
MKVVCAWCKQEGRDALLGECAPFDDPTETHTICPRHSEQLVAQLPSVTFPGIRILYVVRRNDTALYRYLAHSLAGLPGVAVILDRRERERRIAPGDVPIERRRANRRIRRTRFSSLGYLVVRFGPEREGRLAPEPPGKPPGPPRRPE